MAGKQKTPSHHQRILKTPTVASVQDLRFGEDDQHLCLLLCNPDSIRVIIDFQNVSTFVERVKNFFFLRCLFV